MKTLLILALVTFVTFPCFAQDKSDSHYLAAKELLLVMNTPELIESSIIGMIDLQKRHNPMLEAFEDIFYYFFNKHMSWDNLKDVYIQLYMDEFTESELHEITAFYKTETGQKAAMVNPVLMQKGMDIGEQIVMNNMTELEELIDKRINELSEID